MGWAKALNTRNFQDKMLRIIQYGSRAASYYILRTDAASSLGKKFVALYKQLSISRKGFRCGKSITEMHTSVGFIKELIKEPSGERAAINAMKAIAKALMVYATFWDNMVFITHVSLVNRPQSRWWSKNAVKQRQID